MPFMVQLFFRGYDYLPENKLGPLPAQYLLGISTEIKHLDTFFAVAKEARTQARILHRDFALNDLLYDGFTATSLKEKPPALLFPINGDLPRWRARRYPMLPF